MFEWKFPEPIEKGFDPRLKMDKIISMRNLNFYSKWSLIKIYRNCTKYFTRHSASLKILSRPTSASMTQLLTHSVAHSTKPYSRPKTNNQSIKVF